MFEVAITQRHGDFTLDTAFEAKGGVTALFGRSGAGKSSIIKAIAGLSRPDAGRIVVGDTVLFDSRAGVDVAVHKRRLGLVFQEARLFPHLSVRQNLTFGARFAPAGGTPASLPEIAELLGLAALLDRRPGTLSGGEKGRVAIGRALMARPRALLMDEPLAALDAPRRAEILGYLERLRDVMDLPILYVSHALPEVIRLAQTLILLADGRVSMAGPLDQVLTDPAAARVLGPRDMGAVVSARVLRHEEDGLTSLSALGGTLLVPRVAAAPGSDIRLRILAQDVMLSLAPLAQVSALNQVTGVIEDLRPGDGPGVLVRITTPGGPLLARITARSATGLSLKRGQSVQAVLKAVSVARDNIG